MLEIAEVRKYTNRILHGTSDQNFSPPPSAEMLSDAELDLKYSPYVESYAKLQKYSIASAFRILQGEIQDDMKPQFELGIPDRKGRKGDTMSVRWNKRTLPNGIDVSQGAQVELHNGLLLFNYLFPSIRPSQEALNAIIVPEERDVLGKKVILGGWRNYLEVNADEMVAQGEINDFTMSEWLKLTMHHSIQPYFDYTSSHGTADEMIDAKQIFFPKDTSEGEVYFQFKN